MSQIYIYIYVAYRIEKQPEDVGIMVALLNEIDKEITSQKKRGITFITKEILNTGMSL